MSCIAAFVDEQGHITMGGDSASVGDNEQITVLSERSPKVIRRGILLIGSVGLGAGIDYLRYIDLPEIKVGDDVTQYMRVRFLNFLKDTLPERIKQANEFLVGIQGRIFRIFGARSIEEAIEPYNAIGSGRQSALGFLFATCNVVDLSAYAKVYGAVRAAEHFTSGVGGPVLVFNDRPEGV